MPRLAVVLLQHAAPHRCTQPRSSRSSVYCTSSARNSPAIWASVRVQRSSAPSSCWYSSSHLSAVPAPSCVVHAHRCCAMRRLTSRSLTMSRTTMHLHNIAAHASSICAGASSWRRSCASRLLVVPQLACIQCILQTKASSRTCLLRLLQHSRPPCEAGCVLHSCDHACTLLKPHGAHKPSPVLALQAASTGAVHAAGEFDLPLTVSSPDPPFGIWDHHSSV